MVSGNMNRRRLFAHAVPEAIFVSPALIGVGYGGLRIVSRDNGKTWGDRASDIADGKDDEYLLRAVVYGKGRWIATGWKLWTSDDGVNWTPHGMIKDGPKIRGCSIVEGLAYKDGYFYAACPVSSRGRSTTTSLRSSAFCP